MKSKHLMALISVVFCLIGCSGVSEEFLKSTGVDYTINEESGDVAFNVDVGGFSMQTQSGPNVKIPDGFPIVHPEHLKIESISTIQADGANVTTVSFRLEKEHTVEEIVAFYQGQYEGCAIQHNSGLGVKTTVITIDLARAVTISNLADQKSLTLTYTIPVPK